MECDFTASRRSYVAAHKRIHRGFESFACQREGCDAQFANAATLSGHDEQAHLGVKPFPCMYPMCLYAAKSWTLLDLHLKRHRGEKPYACHVDGCGYAARKRSTLIVHTRQEHNEMPPHKKRVRRHTRLYIRSAALAAAHSTK